MEKPEALIVSQAEDEQGLCAGVEWTRIGLVVTEKMKLERWTEISWVMEAKVRSVDFIRAVTHDELCK